MRRGLAAALATFMVLGTARSAQAEGDAVKGVELYAVCAGCHGANGEGNQAMKAPAIAGQEDWYLVRQLSNYKQGVPGADPKDASGMMMRQFAASLGSEQDVEDVAAYVASLPASPKVVTLGGDPVVGESFYAVCERCHGTRAEGSPALNAPGLKGQHDWYLVGQIEAFQSGIRGNHAKDVFGNQMRPMSLVVADKQMAKDIAAYITGLK